MRSVAASFQTTGSFTADGTPLSDVADLLQIVDPTDRTLPPGRVRAMDTALTDLRTGPAGCDDGAWPSQLAGAWRAVTSGTAAIEAADHLWPHYLHRVCDWTTSAQHAPRQRALILTTAHDRLRTAPTSPTGAP
ncbi:hypothetical protein [Streptomyces sp. NPDC059783]|uniref:hypothetical protein n=1 Tax=Streptomyces sp. NPDC059783 TaxID=3346944 RepID=UPI0036498FD8